ncbi:hypothetical protein HN954_00970 [bacterium]|jgi:hypothetical protein|nr:hypothetical protein [bacterium]MBT6831893.1 hypothetical protein [bacterium]MBT6995983.1 hypothetical protein [bacterium]MBT7772258.1 hypothetical protein [bacterium]
MIPQELIDWITGEKAKGYTSEQLYDILMQHDNEEEAVREGLKIVFQSTVPVEPATPEKKPSKFNHLIFAGIAIVVLIVGGVFFYSTDKEANQEKIQDNIQKELVKKEERKSKFKGSVVDYKELLSIPEGTMECFTDNMCRGFNGGFNEEFVSLCLTWGKEERGICKEIQRIRCIDDSECNDENPLTIDKCKNPRFKSGQEREYCVNYIMEPITEWNNQKARETQIMKSTGSNGFQPIKMIGEKSFLSEETPVLMHGRGKDIFGWGKNLQIIKGGEIIVQDQVIKYPGRQEYYLFGFSTLGKVEDFEGKYELEGNIVPRGNITFDAYNALGYVPDIVRGNLDFKNVTVIPEGFQFPKIVEHRVNLLDLTSAEHLVLPEEIRELHLGLESAEHLILPQKVETLKLDSLESAEHLILPQKVKDISLSGLTSAKHLIFPEEITGYISLHGLSEKEINKLKKIYDLERMGRGSGGGNYKFGGKK